MPSNLDRDRRPEHVDDGIDGPDIVEVDVLDVGAVDLGLRAGEGGDDALGAFPPAGAQAEVADHRHDVAVADVAVAVLFHERGAGADALQGNNSEPAALA